MGSVNHHVAVRVFRLYFQQQAVANGVEGWAGDKVSQLVLWAFEQDQINANQVGVVLGKSVHGIAHSLCFLCVRIQSLALVKLNSWANLSKPHAKADVVLEVSLVNDIALVL
ncbi:hypothetical protein CHS0354_004435 [Potamilus streckersoni]|uniref:Uncharacterized protein n=1 Tax=Potamilus streckersoni TaxID=2493646 RepID=A0AAE0WA86_9BIVA|nr:hypothetical protein CHS0354_004435 [Potamilus streckersoni]